ncbi:MAG: hypothetical protein PHD67_10260 [Oscillospiraceae bacterium]|nr:hypothetical protein [Oscillospiraceae bacterium]
MTDMQAYRYSIQHPDALLVDSVFPGTTYIVAPGMIGIHAGRDGALCIKKENILALADELRDLARIHCGEGET